MTSTIAKIPTGQLWRKREAKCLAIIEKALDFLAKTRPHPKSEIEINRKLYFHLLEASLHLYPEDEIAPVAECNNQADPDDEARAAREQKRPDFQWAYLDRYEADPRRSSKQFVVECKRLGAPASASWKLNHNYVHNGIERFREEDFGYGRLAESGVMIGYIESMTPPQILVEVNSECHGRTLPTLALHGTWIAPGTTRLEHTLTRMIPISPFKLHHFWVDLR